MKKIDVIDRREDNGGTMIIICIDGYEFARWYKEAPSDGQVRKDYQTYGARYKRKWKGEFLAYDRSRGQFLN